MRMTVKKWGNSLGVRIPSAYADAMKISEGTPIEIVLRSEKEEIVIRRLKRPKKYSLEELLAKIPKNNELHDEIDWGQPVGREL